MNQEDKRITKLNEKLGIVRITEDDTPLSKEPFSSSNIKQDL